MDKLIQGEMRRSAMRIRKMMEKKRGLFEATKQYGGKFLTTVRPLSYSLLIQGQYPFSIRKETETEPVEFIQDWLNSSNTLYLCAFFFGLFNFLLLSFGYFSFFIGVYQIGVPTFNLSQENIQNLGTEMVVYKDWEKERIRQYFSILLIIYLWILSLMIMNVTLFLRREAFLNFLNYWLHSFQVILCKLLLDVYFKMLMEIFFAVGVISTLMIMSLNKLGPTISNILDVMSYLYLRPVHYLYPEFQVPPEILTNNRGEIIFYVYKIPGIIILATAYIGGRSTVIHCNFYNRLLAGISKTWNQRLRDGIQQNEVEAGKVADTSHPKIRIELRQVLEDHYNIVQLYKMTEDLFGNQLIVYYFLETLGMIFELYHLVSVYNNEKVIDERYDDAPGPIKVGIFLNRLNMELSKVEYKRATGEFYVALLTFLFTSVYVFITTDCANSAYVEGMAGFQILRRNCYLGNCDTTRERNLIHSLIVSYAKNNPILISANGYFEVNRSLVAAIMLNVMGYLVAAYTLKPDTSEFWNFGQYANLCRPRDPRATDELCGPAS